MATIPPPPSKRRRLEAEAHSREQHKPKPIPEGSIRITFIDISNGQPAGPTVCVPRAQANVKNLQILLNSLQGRENASDRLSYRLYRLHKGKNGAREPLGDGADVDDSFIKTGDATAEEEISLEFAPQAVFKVRPVSRCSAAVSGHGQPILAAQFSPENSARLATGSGDNTARMWDCETGTPFATLKGHTSWVLVVSWSPDDTTLATGSNDNTVRLWDQKGKGIGDAMKGHSGRVNALSWEPFHKQEPGRPRLASSSKDTTVRIWDTTSQRCDIVLTGHKGNVSCVRWGGTGFIYTASHDKTVKVWNASDGTLAHTLNSHAHWVNHLSLSTEAALRTGYHDHTRQVPSTTEAKLSKATERFEEAAKVDGAISERLVTASDDFTIFLWEPSKSTKPIARLQGHQKQVNHVTFSPDGMYIASASFDNLVKLWNARDGKFITTLKGHVGSVYQCCFSPDSRLLVSGSKDTTLKVWDVATGKLKMDLPGHKDEVYAVDWAPDGERVASGGKDRAVRIWRH